MLSDPGLTEKHNRLDNLPKNFLLNGKQLNSFMMELKRDLYDSEEFHQRVIEAKQLALSAEQPVVEQELSKNFNHRLILVALSSRRHVPVHDHPNSITIQLVLHGQVRVRHYDEVDLTSNKRLIKLRCTSQRILNRNDIDIVGREMGNLHSLSAIGGTAVCLSLQLPPCEKNLQNSYYPADPFINDKRFSLWYRAPNACARTT